MIEVANKLFETFQESKDKWNFPFNIGVFGTLRLNCGNSWRMGRGPNGENSDSWYRENKRPSYASHHKAFMPHFSASGLSIQLHKNKAAAFEVFTYTPEQWELMIGHVDSLEGFSPRAAKYKDWGYFRTLAWLHILPDDFKDILFEDPWHHDPRVLPIPVSEWKNYPRCPCWVYSSYHQNEQSIASKLEDQPIIWYGNLESASGNEFSSYNLSS